MTLMELLIVNVVILYIATGILSTEDSSELRDFLTMEFDADTFFCRVSFL
jgi:hypothetical protein